MAEKFIFFRPDGSLIKITIDEIMNKKLNKEISALTGEFQNVAGWRGHQPGRPVVGAVHRPLPTQRSDI